MLRCSNVHKDDKFHWSWHSSLSIVNLDQLLYFASRLNGLDNWCPRMIQLCLSMQVHNCYQSLRLRISRSSSTSSSSSIKNSSSGRSGSNGSNFAFLLFLWTSNYASRQGSRFPGDVFFHKGGSGKTKLMFAKLGEMTIYLHFKQKELAASMKKILLFATLFLVMWLTFKPEAKGRWWRGTFWGNTWPRKRDAMPRFYFWLYALKLMNQVVSTAG